MPRASYPILIDLTDRQCVIIGGGKVAVRKAQGLIEAGATRVHMIAPVFDPDVPQGVRQTHACYRPEHLEQAGIVFAATNITDVNDAVIRDAKARGILASRADNGEELPGDFVAAARFQKGPITVAVSAGSAALSVMIRDAISSHWEPGWTALAEAMVVMRSEVKQRWDEPTRRQIFRDLATTQAMEIIGSKGVDGLRDWIDQRYGRGVEARA